MFHIVINDAPSGQRLEGRIECSSFQGAALTLLFSQQFFGNKHNENTIITKINIHVQQLHGRDYIQVKDVCNPVCQASNTTRRPVHLHRVSLQHLGVCSIKILPWWEKTDFQMVTLLIQ